jgi:hypothetical protein
MGASRELVAYFTSDYGRIPEGGFTLPIGHGDVDYWRVMLAFKKFITPQQV